VKDWESRQEKKRGLLSFDFEVEEIQNVVWEKTEIKRRRKTWIKRRGSENERKE